jgi:hypothetical protein
MLYFGAAGCCRRVGVDMTEVDEWVSMLSPCNRSTLHILQLINAGPAAANAADGGGAADSYVVAIVDVTGVSGRLHFFGGTKQSAVDLIIETTMYGKWQRVASVNAFHRVVEGSSKTCEVLIFHLAKLRQGCSFC